MCSNSIPKGLVLSCALLCLLLVQPSYLYSQSSPEKLQEAKSIILDLMKSNEALEQALKDRESSLLLKDKALNELSTLLNEQKASRSLLEQENEKQKILSQNHEQYVNELNNSLTVAQGMNELLTPIAVVGWGLAIGAGVLLFVK